MTSQSQTLTPPQLEQLVELAEVLSQQSNFNEVLRVVTQRTSELLDAEIGLIMMLNPRTQQTVKTIVRKGQDISHPRYHSAQNQVTGWIMKNREPLLTADIQTDPRFPKVSWGDLPVKSVLGMPLRVEGAHIGALILLNKTAERAFDKVDLAFLSKLALISAPYLRNVQKIQEYFEAPMPDEALLGKYESLGLLGKSRSFVQLLQSIESAARCDVRVLLQGGSGSGKELVARAVHKFSARSSGPFVAVDCGAIPAHLLESELFGHVKGAFTGATADRKGLFQEANRGTLFMDEIANLPLDMQTKLMRVLQEGEVRPLGSNRSQSVDVRIITASSGSIKDLVREKRFREDLFYRIYVYPIQVPALDERCEDIQVLANHFLRRFVTQQKKQAESFHQDVLDFMCERHWEGNVRELENFVERLVVLAPQNKKVLGREVLPDDLKEEMRQVRFVYDDNQVPKSLTENLADYEEQLILQALRQHDWNQSRAARSLKIPVQTIRYKMKKLGIEKENDQEM